MPDQAERRCSDGWEKERAAASSIEHFDLPTEVHMAGWHCDSNRIPRA